MGNDELVPTASLFPAASFGAEHFVSLPKHSRMVLQLKQALSQFDLCFELLKKCEFRSCMYGIELR